MSSPYRRLLASLTTLVLAATGTLLASPASAVPVPQEGKAAIFGVVTPAPGGTFSGQIAVQLFTSAGAYLGLDMTDGSGAYEFTNLAPDTYRLNFDYQGSGPWADTGWAPPGGVEGGFFSLAANQVLEANGPLHIGGSIAGTVSVPSNARSLPVTVTAYNNQGVQTAATTTDAAGAYVLAGLAAGQYRVSFSGNLLKTEYWLDAPSHTTATPVTVAYGQVSPNISPVLSTRSVITGTVRQELLDGGTAPLAGATVRLTRISDSASWTTTTDRDGAYVMGAGPEQGEFILGFEADASAGLAPEYWNNATHPSEATVLTNGQGELKAGYDVTLARGAHIVGRVSYDLGTQTALAGGKVRLFRQDADASGYTLLKETSTAGDGSFGFGSLPSGAYVLKASDTSGLGLAAEYWQDARLFDEATTITLAEGESVVLSSDIVLEPVDVETARLAGSNRYGTGVAITRKQFPGSSPDVPVVYIASGVNYPDALSAGPAAIAEGGTLLLVQPTAIPSSVAAELDRLDPDRIVIVGSSVSVSDAIARQLELYVDSPSQVIRLGGANRFETSALVARHAFGESGATTAFFATGNNYPDALAAGPAAAQFDAPVILVNGSASGLTAGTEALMADLGVSTAEVLGSSVTVSDAVFADIGSNLLPNDDSDTGTIRRHEGSNRYSTAVAVNEFAFPEGADQALLTSGTGFADALSGGPLAGAWGVPLYLSKPTCVPQDVVDGLVDLQVAKAWLLGSPTTLSDTVMSLGSC